MVSMMKNEDEGLNLERKELNLMYDWWPDNFGSLFDMGSKSFEMLFHHRPQLKAYFGDNWEDSDLMKKIVLSLEQTLVQCVNTYGDVAAPLTAHDEYLKYLRELGGLHRIIVPNVNLDNFELLFKLLPEVIVDVTSARRTEGPIPPDIRARLLRVWQHACAHMSRQVVLGWERRVTPTNPKFVKAVRHFEERQHSQEKKKSGGSFRKSSGGSIGAVPKSPGDLKKIQSLTVIELSRSIMGLMPLRQRAESSGGAVSSYDDCEPNEGSSRVHKRPTPSPIEEGLRPLDVEVEMLSK